MRRILIVALFIGGLTAYDVVTAAPLREAQPAIKSRSSQLVKSFLDDTSPSLVGRQLIEVDVPSIGCPQDGQIGPRRSPTLPGSVRVSVPRDAAPRLAYYSASATPGEGVLGPRGWDCFGIYGSNGSQLFVVPRKMDGAILDRPRRIKENAVIIRGVLLGDTSGRFAAAHLAARLFPNARHFVEAVRDEGMDSPESYNFAPWPNDRIKYLRDFAVSFITPAGKTGVGTQFVLTPGPLAISGLILADGIADHAAQGQEASSPYLSTLLVRLAAADLTLYPAIAIAQLRFVAPAGERE